MGANLAISLAASCGDALLLAAWRGRARERRNDSARSTYSIVRS